MSEQKQHDKSAPDRLACGCAACLSDLGMGPKAAKGSSPDPLHDLITAATNAVTFLEAIGYTSGDIHDDLAAALRPYTAEDERIQRDPAIEVLPGTMTCRCECMACLRRPSHLLAVHA